jgi:hypothetical protein
MAKRRTKKRRKNYAVSPSELVPIIKRWAKAEKCDGDLAVMTGRKWSRDVASTDADVIVCCKSKLLRAIRKQGDVMEGFSELLGEHGYSYAIKGDEIRVHGLGINPGKKAAKKNPILARGTPQAWRMPRGKRVGEPHAISKLGNYTVELFNLRKTPLRLPAGVRPSPWMAKVYKGRRVARDVGMQGFIGGATMTDAQRNVLREIQI